MNTNPTSKPKRRTLLSGAQAPNAIHLLLGVLADCQQSMKALRHEIGETWGDLELLRRELDNAFWDLEGLDAKRNRPRLNKPVKELA